MYLKNTYIKTNDCDKLNHRLRDLTSQNERLKQQLADKELSVTQLQVNLTGLEGRLSRDLVGPQSSSAPPRDNLDILYDALRRITEEALNDGNRASLEDIGGDFDISSAASRLNRQSSRLAKDKREVWLW